MDTTPSGLKRPADSDTMGSTAATLRQHANSFQAGMFSVTTTAGTTISGTVTFPVPYPSGVVPLVLTAPVTASPGNVSVAARDITNTGFTYYVYRASSGSLGVQWFAFGQGSEVGG